MSRPGIVALARSALEEVLSSTGEVLLVLGEAVYWFRAAWEKRHEILRLAHSYVFGGFAVTMTVALFSGMVLALQTGMELTRYGQQATVGLIVAASMCREMGPVMTGYIMAGLVGTRITTELAAMRHAEEIDALHVMTINPVRFLAMPRVAAVVLLMPVLTVYTDIVGIVGGSFIADRMLAVPPDYYFGSALAALTLRDVYLGLLKSLVFGMTFAAVACAEGLRVERGPMGTGKAITRTVVFSFIGILIFDYLLTWMFY